MTPNQQHLLLRRSSLILISGILFASLLLPTGGYAAYSEPTLNPPRYDTDIIPELLHTSGSNTYYQQKLGSLLIGTPTNSKQLCLNPNLTVYPGASDPGNCISSWSELSSQATGFLRRFDGNATTNGFLPPYGNTGNPSTAVPDEGYVGWQANDSDISSSQLFSFIAETPSGTVNTAPGTIPPAAIRAETDTNSYYAGEFLGTLGIVGLGAALPKLCLNDNGTGVSCKSSWAEVIAQADSSIVSLQDLHASQFIVNQGQTSTTGVLVAGALVAGQPLMTTPAVYSCGDNICQSQTENDFNCSIDC